MRRLLPSVVTLIVALAAASGAREAVGNLVGTMVDSHGNPVEGATVVIQTSDGQHPHATHTDANGHFVSWNLLAEHMRAEALSGADPMIRTPEEAEAMFQKAIPEWAEYVRIAKIPQT